jgi:purine nucleosidase
MPRKIIIDTDPGQDDAVAMLLALASPEDLDIVGIVAVAGNIGLERAVKNACKILELSGRTDIRCHAGCERPMRRTLVTAEHVHGETGLGGADLPEPELRLGPQHGVDFIINRLLAEAAGTITLCALGPLTDIAMALVKAPAIAPRIREIVMMGGAFSEGGNITPSAEFNIYVDPEAADIVFTSGVPITVLPLDATHQVLTTQARLDRFAAIGNRTGRTVADMLGFSQRFDLEKYGWQGAPLHDPCVIAYLLRPDLFRGKAINVAIETASGLTRGMTIADWWRVTDRPANALFIREADAAGFYDLLTERLARLP